MPEWVCESRKLEVLDIGHNQIYELPARWVLQILLENLKFDKQFLKIAESVFHMLLWTPKSFVFVF